MILRASARLMARIQSPSWLAMTDKLPEIASPYQPPRARCYHAGRAVRPVRRRNFMVHPHPAARLAPWIRLAVLAAALVYAGSAGAADPILLRINSFPNAKALPLQAGIG